MRRRLLTPLAAALLAASSAAQELAPWTAPAEPAGLERDERNLWAEAEEFDRALERSGKLLKNPALDTYLQGVMDRLYPEFGGRIRVRALDSNRLNAFALPNGSVYINTGLLARLQNEAQLATVLAHEGAHFVHRHSLQQIENAKNAAAVALVVGMAGVPVVGNVVALGSMSGFSREHENQADHIGFQRLVAAGYSAKEAPKTFEHLIAEIKALDIDEPFFFASHPRLQDRVDTLSELAKAGGDGEVRREPYVMALREVRLRALREDLDAYRYKQLILVLSDPARRREYPPEAGYFLGEAYRLRNQPGDAELAEREYTLSMELAPAFAPAYRALGMLHYRRGEKNLAAPLFRHYLELAPDAADREYIELYLKEAGR
ncbi:MAG: M48 family metalloprotease [Pseudomonadota bacterium]